MNRMIVPAIALISGALFGLGLQISEMMAPAKVINFLDLTGQWDPSLAFVMGGALAVYMPGYWLLKRLRQQPLVAAEFHTPQKNKIDPRLLLGAALFGAGWGIAGFCPGPAVAALGRGLFTESGLSQVLLFTASMLIGLRIAAQFNK